MAHIYTKIKTAKHYLLRTRCTRARPHFFGHIDKINAPTKVGAGHTNSNTTQTQIITRF